MPSKYADIIGQPTPQSEPLTKAQVANNAGGFVYALDKWARLDRFLILGSDSPTYYQQARPLTLENAAVVRECYAEDAGRTVANIAGISDAGRAPKNDPAIFALAIGAAFPDQTVRQVALAALPRVCRTSTHLFQFVGNCKALGRGFGRAFKRAIAAWYTDKPIGSVAYQAIKYRSREGYTHKRLLDMSHAPSADDAQRQALYHWIKGKQVDIGLLPDLIDRHLTVMASTNLKVWTDNADLPWEAFPTEANAQASLWQAMLPTMGLTALIRNLGNMTRIGAISPLSESEGLAVNRLTDLADLRKSRVHPFAVLQAAAVYGSGKGFRGSGTWAPSQPILSALNKAFHMAFANVEPTGKRFLLGLDVSGSMTTPFMGSPLTCRDATAALALVTTTVEPACHVVGFTGSQGYYMGGRPMDLLTKLNIHAGMDLRSAVAAVSGLRFGGTDCALPMLYALENKIPVDCFVVLTDNETWAGSVHPSVALRQYRAQTGIPAKLVVVGMTSTGFTIADPNDGGMMDIVGFDANCPALIADFARG